MIHAGSNLVRGIPVEVERRRARRYSLRVRADGSVRLTVPAWRGTLAEGEAFLLSKWEWVERTRARMLAIPRPAPLPPVGPEERFLLETCLHGLMDSWMERLGEAAVTWQLRAMKTRWGSCHIVRRHIVFNDELARKPYDLVEYVVVHELTHLKATGHGPRFQALMDARLPGWRLLRRRLNER